MASYREHSDLLELQLTSQPYDTHQGLAEVRIADAERVKNFRRAVTTSVQEAKPLGDDITKEQWGTLKNLRQDYSRVVHMADSSTAVVLLDTDPYHAMKTLTH